MCLIYDEKKSKKLYAKLCSRPLGQRPRVFWKVVGVNDNNKQVYSIHQDYMWVDGENIAKRCRYKPKRDGISDYNMPHNTKPNHLLRKPKAKLDEGIHVFTSYKEAKRWLNNHNNGGCHRLVIVYVHAVDFIAAGTNSSDSTGGAVFRSVYLTKQQYKKATKSP